MNLLVLIRSLLKQGYASAEQKKEVATKLKALDAEEQEALQEDAGKVAELPEGAPAPSPASDEDAEQAALEKGIKTLVATSTKAAAKEAVDAMKSEVKEWLESQKEAIQKKAGIYHPEVQEKRAKMNAYIRDFSKALIKEDYAKVKELTTDDTGSPFGGYVVDTELSMEILHLTTEYGVARREMTTLQLSKNAYRVIDLVTDVTVYWVDEGAVIPSTQVVLGQDTLSLKKLAAIVAITRELLEDEEVDLFAFIGNRVAEKFAQAEDQMAFIGDGTSTYGGFTGIFNAAGVNEVTLAATNVDFTDVTADELLDMQTATPSSVRKNGKYYGTFSVMGIFRKLKDSTGNYIFQGPTTSGPATLWGRPFLEVDVLPDTGDTAADTAFLGYGDLKRSSIFAYRGAIAMDRFNAGSVRNVANNADINLITTDREAVRWIERVGVIHVIPSAFTVLKTAAA